MLRLGGGGGYCYEYSRWPVTRTKGLTSKCIELSRAGFPRLLGKDLGVCVCENGVVQREMYMSYAYWVCE